MTQVINMRNAPVGWEDDPQFVYIGRPGRGWTAETAPFGKPREYDDKPNWPELYRAYLNRELQTNAEFAARVFNLWGATLICFCKPKPCHGDTLVKAVDWLNSDDGIAWIKKRYPDSAVIRRATAALAETASIEVFEDIEDPAYWADQPERS